MIVEKCKTMDSAKVPLWLVFKNADPFGEPIWLIFKSGDDLRQDVLTLQMLGIMDKVWTNEGINLCLTPYKCISTGDGMGMIETVLNSDTTANIQYNSGGVTGPLKQTALADWLRKLNSEPGNLFPPFLHSPPSSLLFAISFPSLPNLYLLSFNQLSFLPPLS